MPVPLLNAQTGQIELLDQPEKAFLSGTHGFRAGVDVHFVNPEDNKIYVAKSDRAQEVLNSGLRFASPQQIRERKLEREYGEGFGSGAKAFGEGIARGVSFGLSDMVLKDIFDVTEEALSERKKRRKALAITGEVSGAVLPILLSGGTGALAKGASVAPTAVLARIGTRAEKEIAKRILREGVAKKALPRIGAAALEGGVYGLGHLTSEAALGNTEFTAENAVSHIGMGSLFAGGLTAGFMGGAAAARKTLLPMGKGVGKFLDKRFSEKALRSAAGEKAFQSGRGTLKFYKEAGKMKHGRDGVGQDLLEKGVIKSGRVNTIDEMFSDSSALRKQYGQALEDTYTKVDDALIADPSIAKIPSGKDILKDVNEKILKPLREDDIATLNRVAKRIEDDLQSLAKKETPTLTEIWRFRRKLDTLVKWSKVDDPGYSQSMYQARNIIEKNSEKIIDQVIKKAKLDTPAYQETKRLWQSMKVFSDMAEDTIERDSRNRFISLTDYITGGAAGVGTSNIFFGTLGALTHKFFRKNLSAQVALGVNKLSQLGGLQRINNVSTDRMSKVVSQYLSGKGKKLIPPVSAVTMLNTPLFEKKVGPVSSMAESFKKRREELITVANDPRKLIEKIAESTEGIHGDAPGVARDINMIESKALKFLFQKLPKNPLDFDFEREDDWVPNDSEMAKWARYYAAVTNPDSVLSDLENGRLTSEGVEALRAIYPKRYDLLVNEIVSQISETDKSELPYSKKIELSNILGIPLSNSLRPQFIQLMQQNFLPPPPPGPERSPARAKGLDKITASESTKTGLEKSLSPEGGG